MWCNNCAWYPIEESEEDASILICPNCGHEYIEGPNHHFIRGIYEKFMKEDKIPELENLDWLQDEIREPDEQEIARSLKLYKVLDEYLKKN